MKYFLDTEFHEYKRKPYFSRSVDTIELISIGIVAEDGREYYAISKDFDIKAAWDNEWLRFNVLKNLFNNEKFKHYSEPYSRNELKKLIDHFGKSNKQIAEDVKEFCLIGFAMSSMDRGTANLVAFTKRTEETNKKIEELNCKYVFDEIPSFYGYYSDYDWVVFCWLFGRMIDLPEGFPMYCNDLKQILDEKQAGRNKLKKYIDESDGALTRHEESRLVYPLNLKEHEGYPKQANEHNALADAKWNFELYKFLQSI